ncbi:hypothetical protein GCM10011579_081760 [Streptomyces albiflavescens]|uniref:Uncharacterized protein n=1 Tax=Streptomyces albiflavescens TaxID=1623582 RepID=A0A917YD37_9ACTN|nr:hypothetical protein GCM10011579_081760 [Streptomyces albiflavescens]
MEGEWALEPTPHDRYTEWVGLCSTDPNVVVRLIEKTGGRETWHTHSMNWWRRKERPTEMSLSCVEFYTQISKIERAIHWELRRPHPFPYPQGPFQSNFGAQVPLRVASFLGHPKN